jgi:hypothetical protein
MRCHIPVSLPPHPLDYQVGMDCRAVWHSIGSMVLCTLNKYLGTVVKASRYCAAWTVVTEPVILASLTSTLVVFHVFLGLGFSNAEVNYIDSYH